MNSVDYGEEEKKTKTPSMQRRLGSTTLSQLVIPGGKQPEFSTGEIPFGQYSCLKKSYERWGGACMGYPKRVDAISN